LTFCIVASLGAVMLLLLALLVKTLITGVLRHLVVDSLAVFYNLGMFAYFYPQFTNAGFSDDEARRRILYFTIILTIVVLGATYLV